MQHFEKDHIFGYSGSTLRQMRLQKSIDRKQQMQKNKRYKKESIYEQNNIVQQELDRMKGELDYRLLRKKSKASPHLLHYIQEQDKSIKKAKVKSDSTERQSIQMDLRPIAPQGLIQIPDVRELFKEQAIEWMIHQSKKMRNHIESNLESLKNTVKALGTSSQSKILPSVVKRQNLQLVTSRKLRKNLQKYKEKIRQQGIDSSQIIPQKKTDIFSQQKPKKQKIVLKGVRSISVVQKSSSRQMLPSTYVMYQFKNMAQLKQRKQRQLSSLLKNSYLNRQDILNDKMKFYSKQTQYYDLSLASQMHLKQIMKKKLQHRLQLSKRQIQLFTQLLKQTKQAHIIIEQGLIELLVNVRSELITGKTIRKIDFQEILKNHVLNLDDQYTKSIVVRLRNMMF